MGRSKKGILGSVNGKVGNVVFYDLNGQDVVRSRQRQHKIVSPALKLEQKSMALLIRFLSKVKPFIKAGFKNEALGSNQNYHNLAASYNKLYALDKADGIPKLIYEHILLSRGTALPAANAQFSLVDEHLLFTWENSAGHTYVQSTDQVMLLAYFPEINEALYTLAGNIRGMGEDKLYLSEAFRSLQMHCYISFIAQDRESVSNSLYLGTYHNHQII